MAKVFIVGDTRWKNKLKKKMQARIHDTKRQVVVTYTAPYALYVHENTQMKLAGQPRPSGIGVYWGPSGQAKFLEVAIRQNRAAMQARIAQVSKSTNSVIRGLRAGGTLLRNASQKLVPVETGQLRDSAQVIVE